MKRVTVFYNGKVWYETDGIATFSDYPEGAYVRRRNPTTGMVYWGKMVVVDGIKDHVNRTPEGLIGDIYRQQKYKAKKRGYTPPSYTGEELLAWALSQPNFQQLYSSWEASGFQTEKRPSVDRLNDYISYTLSNIQLTTWTQNNQKNYSSQEAGDNNKKNLAVDMLDLEGNFIQRFHSASAAARHFNGIPSNIIGAINGRTVVRRNPDGSSRTWNSTTAYGHKWRYSSQPNDNTEVIP